MTDKGLTGLVNLGNECYINACTQILVHSDLLNHFLDTPHHLNDNMNGKFLTEYDNLRKLMWSKNCVINHRAWIISIQTIAEIKDMVEFIGSDQNDISEFLLFIINTFHEAVNRKVDMTINGTEQNDTDTLAKISYQYLKQLYESDYSEIVDMFYGIQISQIRSNTNKLSLTPESMILLNVSIPHHKSPTLTDCLDDFYKIERLEGETAWYNDVTKLKEPAQKQYIVWSFPKILIIILKRFNNNNRKDQRLVSCPTESLDLSKYVVGYLKHTYQYDLYGVCNHSGGTLGGHYTATIKNKANWYHYNDTDVKKISESKVISAKAYCLFYKKKNIK